MKQQPLPWNVTGIPPEARQLARDAASREGLSVGDWLTRRILNESNPGQMEERAGEASTFMPPMASEENEIAKRLARVEAETDSGFGMLSETLRALGHRLEATERSQLEANRAMSTAAAEINAATLEQARAFETLTQRLDRVERTADGGHLRDAVRALHQALSRLAEQAVRATADTSGQISGIAGNLDSLAERMSSAHGEFTQQIAKVAEQSQELSDRLKIAEERLTLATPLEDVVLQLQVRMTAVEEHFNQMTDRNFESAQQNMEIIRARLERIEQSQNESSTQMQETLRALNERLDALDPHSADSLSDLRAGMESVTDHLDAEPTEHLDAEPEEATGIVFEAEAETETEVEATVEVETPPPLIVQPVPVTDEFDLPPFPESPLAKEPLHAHSDEDFSAFVKDSPAEVQDEPPSMMSLVAETYLASARRAAQAAAIAEASNKSRSSLSSIRSHVVLERERNTGRKRALVVAGLLVFIIVVTGFLVIRSATPFAPTPIAAPAPEASTTSLSITPDLPPVQGPQDFAGDAAPAPIAPQATLDTPALGSAPTAPTIAPIPAVPPPSVVTPPPQMAAPLDKLLAKARAGSAPAALLLGLNYADGDGVAVNDNEAARWLTNAAQRGEAVAQYRLGTLYERGRGVKADNAQAFFWYKQAAASGNRKAMHNLAVAYADGVGTEKNFSESARWFRSAAELGLTDSQFNLAVLYERGLGVPVTQPEAYKWYIVAAAGGDTEARARANALSALLSPQQRQTGEKAAQTFVPRSLDRGANEPPNLAQIAP